MEVAELAARMAAGEGNPKRSENGLYYMVNVNHPIIAALKRRFCESRGIKTHIPMSDKERYEFELWLFQPSVRQMVENLLDGIPQHLENSIKKE